MGPGSSATAQNLQDAFTLGRLIAGQGWALLTGGRNEGVMDYASRGAKQLNGLVIGILPDTSPETVSPAVDIAIFTAMGSARNCINVLSSDVIFTCGMGAGTASEVALAIKAEKSVILLNTSPHCQAFFRELASQQVWVANQPEVAIDIANQLLCR